MEISLTQIQTKPQHYHLLEVRNNSVTGPLVSTQYSRYRPVNLFSKKLLRLCFYVLSKNIQCFKLGINVPNFPTFSPVNVVLCASSGSMIGGQVFTFSYLVVLVVEWPCSGSHHCLHTQTFHSFITESFDYQ